MESSHVLKNQEKPSKTSFSLRALFNLFFVISLGFNVYFLVFLDSPALVGHVNAAGLKEVKSLMK